jgi:hypothetical protein
MRSLFCVRLLCAALIVAAPSLSAQTKKAKPAPAAAPQKMDEAYAAKVRELTTAPHFLTEIVDHLPASDKVPTPEKVLGHVIGATGHLTYTKDVHRYMRELEKASPRVKTWVIGKSEEGRETLLVAISDEANIARLDRLKAITAKLADPRKTPEAEAKQLIGEGLPFYWASGSIHSPETASPEMLMELAYRVAVEESPLTQNIRKNSIVLITPTTEVDGRDKMVDLHNWRKANPGRAVPSLIYWGKYVAHDNNRDAMAMTLQLSKIMMKTFLEWHPTVLHDLHESVPFLYTSTGMGPYNAWLDPIVVNEWQKMAYHEVEEMTKRGVPGVWTHGFYDGWAANYMFYVANGHNAIGRFYETFGNRWPETMERTVPETATSRTWYRPNPPFSRLKWSIRNNINLQQSALLLAMNYTATNGKQFLENFYLKSKRSIDKATKEGPSAWVLPADDPRPAQAAELISLLQMQGIEIHRASTDITVGKEKFPAGSYVIRMDQPYSRMADMLLDTQYYNVNDTPPYDDTGWTLGALRNVKTVRVTDPAILQGSMQLLNEAPNVPGSVTGSGPIYLIAHNTDNTLATLRWTHPNLKIWASEAPFESSGRKYPAGSFVIKSDENSGLADTLSKAASKLGVKVESASAAPNVPLHPTKASRIAFVHNWINTQNEGWYRIAFDKHEIPYTYISDQNLAKIPNLRDRFDVVLYGYTPGTAQRLIHGLPKLNDQPMPWKGSDLTPNIGMSPDTTEDMRGGLGLEGLSKIQKFVQDGGLFVTVSTNASIPIDFGLVEGVSIQPARELRVRGSVLRSVVADARSPITYGYGDKLAVYFNQAPILQVATPGAFAGGASAPATRASGRGGPSDPDIPQGRPYIAPPPRPEARPGEETPSADELMRETMRAMTAPPDLRPRVVLKFAEERELLISGMLAGGRELAGKPAVVDVPVGKGHIVLFAINPVWRDQTQGSYFLLFNAMMHQDHLGVGRDARPQPAKTPSDAQ